MDRLRRLSWYERIKTGPSPEDNALLQLTRELSVQFQIPYWYKQIVWGRFDRYDSMSWIISKPSILSKEIVTVPGSVPVAELMLPEYMKGRLSLDEWKILIALHFVRLKAYNQGRMSRLFGKIALAPRGLFFLLLFYVPAATSGGLSVFVSDRDSVFFREPVILAGFRAAWPRFCPVQTLVFSEIFSGISGSRVRPEEIWDSGEQEPDPTIPRFFFLAYWNPSIKERIGELSNPRLVGLPRSSRIPRIGLRGRVITVLVGFGIFWGSGLVAGNIYARGQTTIVCMDGLHGHYLLSPCCDRRCWILDGYYRGHKHRNMDRPTISLS